ncbi:hypothetical protein [Caulobacter sp. RL271]|uniref:Uncharacterized protein n=1 Tax=Caulobacter segnis TaxID=88688 RepID=A0ABY4ZWW2_9CAUL|nr:hypothetical protein [Caulobacter segnis]USQ97261.1 hypothetical protein MZV50_06880 [Caulobacter segnis]
MTSKLYPHPDGIYWLRRRRDGAMRMGFFCRLTWRVADEIGRTRIYGGSIDRLFEVGPRIELPFDAFPARP